MVAIIDYGVGNLGSIVNILKKIGAQACIARDEDSLANAEKFILPGVGSFDYGMEKLQSSGVIKLLSKRVLEDKVPILGICLGMQLFTKMSEEGTVKGLGWIDACTVRFRFSLENQNLKIPHMGWNQVCPNINNGLFNEMHKEPRFYFVHSYHVLCNRREDVVAKTTYGYDFPSVIMHNNIMGVQFHPEKSHKFGMKLLKNFVEL
ncbi:MAG: imidazole glycerol phosphate synthase subunit HisH [Candidatus Omnitrophica bacterium]|nr:imidazole glycerol phosphate synthase subunit HisH [Candidatus Omnitrophota bacterium]